MSRIPLVVFLIAAVAAAGCHRQDRLVGSWIGTSAIMGGVTQTLTLKVAPDGTFTGDIVSSSSRTNIRLVAHDKGTWKNLDNGKYNFTLTDTEWVTQGATPDRAALAHDRFVKNKAKIISQSNKEPDATLTWSGDDKFTLQEGQNVESYTRQK